MSLQDISEALSKAIDRGLITELMKEYYVTKKYHFLGDWEKSMLHASKFSELALAVVKNIVDKEVIDINNIHFDHLCNSLVNRTKITAEDDILTLSIPRVARSIYTLRSKKRVAHVKAIDPDLLDSQYAVSACDWILSEFVMLYLEFASSEVSSIIHSLIDKKIPFVEQFENGSVVVLKEGLTFKEELLTTLYHLSKRMPEKQLTKILDKYPQLINTTARNLEGDKLVHRNEKGVKLTRKGIKFVEEKILAH